MLLLPYVGLAGFAALLHLGLLLAILFNHHDLLNSYVTYGAFILNFLVCLSNFWFVWIVVSYFYELQGKEGYEGIENEPPTDREPVFTKSISRFHSLKPTIVSKLLQNYE